MRFIVIAIFLSLSFGCSGPRDAVDIQDVKVEPSSNAIPPPPDVGNVAVFASCLTQPQRELNNIEKCQIEALKSSCSKKADCYVTCIGSPDGTKVGGGCSHVCGMPPTTGTLPAAFFDCR